MFSNLYRKKKTSFPASSMCNLLRNLEWTRPKVLNIVSIPETKYFLSNINSCFFSTSQDGLCFLKILAWTYMFQKVYIWFNDWSQMEMLMACAQSKSSFSVQTFHFCVIFLLCFISLKMLHYIYCAGKVILW